MYIIEKYLKIIVFITMNIIKYKNIIIKLVVKC